MQPDMDPIEPARVDWDGAIPVAPAFGDAYYSADGGLDESRAVFIDGNHLDERFAALRADDAFVIGETGCGTGLNLLLAASLFLERADAGARLHLVSAEKHPLRVEDLKRALDAWPSLEGFSRRLLEAWPPPTCGFHRIDLDEHIDLTLMFGEAEVMWQAQQVGVDAWFLDGFAPSRNAAMWTPGLFSRMAELSRPGATLATFSAAGEVRRGLAAAGFEVQREPGFGRKRHRLEGRTPGSWRPRKATTGEALIVGAGLAGCTTAYALSRRGWTCRLVDTGPVAGGASGNRAAVVYTTPSGKATPQNRFYQSSWLHALRWLQHAPENIAWLEGVEQIVTDPRQRKKLDGALTSAHWPEQLLQRIDADRVLLPAGGVVRPGAWCRHLLESAGVEIETGRRLVAIEDGRAALFEDGARTEADAIVLCTAGATNVVLPGPDLPIRSIRGQITEVAATRASRGWRRAVCHTGYLVPGVDDVHLVGATFDLHHDDPEPRDDDDRTNMDTLKRWCPDAYAELGAANADVVGRRVGFRCASRDYLPLAGPVDAQGPIWLSIAYGSRGVSSTPLAAMGIADTLSHAPRPMDHAMADALAPTRFRTDSARSG